MATVVVQSAALRGVEGVLVRVEVDVSEGFPRFVVVGLPDAQVREFRARVRSALENAGYEFPAARVTVNLAPADLRKSAGALDLAVALGILAAAGAFDPAQLDGVAALGELALSGGVRDARAALPLVECLAAAGARVVLLGPGAAREAGFVGDRIAVVPVASLAEAVAHLRGELAVEPVVRDAGAVLAGLRASAPGGDLLLEDVRGQEDAKLAMVLAAAGGHSVLLVGPPGSGKTMLAARLPGLFPPLTAAEALEVTRVHSLVSGPDARPEGLVTRRPFRAPHHTISYAGLIGGGSPPRPGEASLAHGGVLFLDELPEFSPPALEALLQWEAGRVHLAHATGSVVYPAAFQLVAAMNSCPCGRSGEASGCPCRCDAPAVARYRARVSGVLLSKFDLRVRVRDVPYDALVSTHPAPAWTTGEARAAVARARAAQARRGCANAALAGRTLEVYAPVDREASFLFQREAQGRGLDLGSRDVVRVRRVARTLADLAGRDVLGVQDVARAFDFCAAAV